MTAPTRTAAFLTAAALLLAVAACTGSAVADTSSTPSVTTEVVVATTTPTTVPTPAGDASTSTTVPAEAPPPGSGRFVEPERLVVLGSVPLTSWVTDVWGHVDDRGREFAIVGSRVGDTARGTVWVVDVTDPTRPVIVSEITDVPALDVKTWGHHVFASDGDAGAGVVIDIADPRAPIVVGTMPPAHNLSLDDTGNLFIARTEDRNVYSVASDPAAPAMSNVVLPGHHDSLAIGDRLYLFGGAERTYVYDTSVRSEPRLLAVIEDPAIEYHHSGWPTEDGRYLFIADETALGDRPDITVWDLADPSAPVLVGGYVDHGAAAHNIQVVGSYAFVSHYGAGIVVLDISDPTNPELVAAHDPIPGKAEGWAFSDYGTFGIFAGSPSGVVYASGSEGLTLLRFTPPRLPAPALR